MEKRVAPYDPSPERARVLRFKTEHSVGAAAEYLDDARRYLNDGAPASGECVRLLKKAVCVAQELLERIGE